MKILYTCRHCSDPIREGDTAYLFDGFCLCAGCVENARTIARRPDESYFYKYPRDESGAVGFPAGIPKKHLKCAEKA